MFQNFKIYFCVSRIIKKKALVFYLKDLNFLRLVRIFALGASLMLFLSCELFTDPHKQLTTLTINAPQRQYHSIIKGDKLSIEFSIKNTGNSLLIIEDVLPSCSCILANFPTSIPTDQYGKITLIYNSSSDIGKVGYHSTVLTNTKQKIREVYFETKVKSKQADINSKSKTSGKTTTYEEITPKS
jgi:hypothetical protein